MDSLKWRGMARDVAYVELVLSIIGLFMVIFLAIVTAASNENIRIITEIEGNMARDGESKIDMDIKAILDVMLAISRCMWLKIGFLAIGVFIQMWAAVKLLKATDVGIQFHEALGKAAIYRFVIVVFLVLQVCGLFLAESDIWEVIKIYNSSLFLYIVQKFMSEVQSRLNTTSLSGQTAVTVKKGV